MKADDQFAQLRDIEAQKAQASLVAMNFNRYLMIRYFSAAYFFSNLYWLVLTLHAAKPVWLFPLIVLVVCLVMVVEQVGKYWSKLNRLKWTKIYYFCQAVLNSVLLIMVLTTDWSFVFPFIKKSGQSFISLFLLVGIMGCMLILRRCWLIEHNHDRYYQHLQAFEHSLTH